MGDLQPGHQQLYHHPEAGQFYVYRFSDGGDHPTGLPFFCAGRYYASEREAVIGFDAEWNAAHTKALVESSIDSSYARMEARMIRPGVFEED